MTYDEAKKSGMDALDILFAIFSGEVDPPDEIDFVHVDRYYIGD